MLINTELESIEAIMCTRRIILAGFEARMEATRLPKCVTGRGRGLGESPGKRVMRCFLNDLRTFDINVDQCPTAAQDKWE